MGDNYGECNSAEALHNGNVGPTAHTTNGTTIAQQINTN